MNTLSRKPNESDVELMERAAKLAKQIKGSVDAGWGPICPTCAPFGSVEGNVVEIYNYQACYNCTYGEDETPKPRN